jgi:hypothetical protein
MENFIDKIRTPSSRAGNLVERVGKLTKAGVCRKAIAAQMTHNSRNGFTYSEEEIGTIQKIYEDSRSKVLMTSSQAKALKRDADDGEDVLILA